MTNALPNIATTLARIADSVPLAAPKRGEVLLKEWISVAALMVRTYEDASTMSADELNDEYDASLLRVSGSWMNDHVVHR